MHARLNSTACFFRRSIRRALYGMAALSISALGLCAVGLAQTPAPAPKTTAVQTQPPAVPQQTPQSQADAEWLTAYMLAHEGYRLDHMPALEKSFSKMSPTQLHTLRDFYEQKHEMLTKQEALIHQMQAQQVNMAAAYQQRQQRALNQFTQEESQTADAETRQINQMHEEAAANAGAARLYGPRIYPSPIFGGYGMGGYPYGPYGGPRYPR